MRLSRHRLLTLVAVSLLGALLPIGCATAPATAPTRSLLPGTRPGEIVVLLFGAVDCPIANGYAPEIAAIAERCQALGLRLLYVYPAQGQGLAEATDHARAFGLPTPVVLDADHRLVDAVGATVTPEAAVVRIGATPRPPSSQAREGGSASLEVLYLGRIDDQYPARGVRRVTATTHELRDAIEAAAAGRPVPCPRTPAVGCLIEPKER
jgi:hypothetical protein